MSTPARLAKGTGLTLGRMVTAIAGQVATVPVYLSYWDVQTYGVWLILQGMFGYLSLFSTAYQQYTYAEMLKSGPDARDTVRTLYWSSLWVAYLIAAAEFGAILALAPQAVSAAVEPSVSSGAAETAATAVHLLILYSAMNLVLLPPGSLTGQTLTIYGHYPRLAAWGLLRTATSLFAPAAAVALGADLLTAGLVLIAGHAIPTTLSLINLLGIARRHGLLARTRCEWKTGVVNAIGSLPLAGRVFVDSLRQQGLRIILSAQIGAAGVTQLATTRTLANVLHQGLSTITAPLMPELMRYVVDRDQARMEGAFAVVWTTLFLLLVPIFLGLCIVAEPLFVFWTRDAVPFDPLLFAMLVVAVLIYAAAQPGLAILQGNNRVIWQFSASAIAAACVLWLLFALVPHFGLRGAAVAILLAETVAAVLTTVGASRTLRRSGLRWPVASFAMVCVGVTQAAVLAVLSVAAIGSPAVLLSAAAVLNLAIFAIYWLSMPLLLRELIPGLLSRFLARRSHYPGAIR